MLCMLCLGTMLVAVNFTEPMSCISFDKHLPRKDKAGLPQHAECGPQQPAGNQSHVMRVSVSGMFP